MNDRRIKESEAETFIQACNKLSGVPESLLQVCVKLLGRSEDSMQPCNSIFLSEIISNADFGLFGNSFLNPLKKTIFGNRISRMMSKKKILLLFPDGVGIRNYLYSDVFKNSTAELILFHNFDNETEADIKERIGITTSLNIPKYKDSIREKFLAVYPSKPHWSVDTIYQFQHYKSMTSSRSVLWLTMHR